MPSDAYTRTTTLSPRPDHQGRDMRGERHDSRDKKPDNKELMALIVEQDRGALETLYDRYAGGVYSLALRMLRDPGAAQEVTQDAFFSVWRRASSYKPSKGSVTAWLFSIAHNRAIDELRRRRRRDTHVQYGVDLTNKPSDGRDDPVDFATAQFQRGRIRDALETLRPEQREVVLLAYYGGLTHSEISQYLEQPLGTVKTRMRLALKRLREFLQPHVQEFPEYGV